MTIDFKDLEIIKEMHNDIKLIKNSFSNRQNKKWLSTKELSEYLDYSQDRIHKLKGVEFFQDVHYYKRSGKLLFDKNKIDDWVLGVEVYEAGSQINVEEKVKQLVDDLLVS